MEIDTIEKVAAVTRSVDTVDREGKPAKLLIAARTYPTSIGDLWDALTNIERIPRWFMPISGELHPGGRFQLEGNASGEILACEPPRRFEATWEGGGDPSMVSWITVELTADLTAEPGDDRTHLELRHVAHVPDDLWDQFGPGAVGIGWDLGLLGLDLHVSSGDPVKPEQVMAWQASANAYDFMARCSDGWGEASIADGADPGAATAAAERVTAMYTVTANHEEKHGQ